MKRQEFTTIEEVIKAQQILSSGILIAQRKERHYVIRLYQVGPGYIEVFIHGHFNVIIKANHFDDTQYLEPYLKTIDIRSAFD